MSSYILLFLLFLLQFFYLPVGMSFFEGAKVYAAEFVILLLLILQVTSKEGIALRTYKKPILISFGILFTVTLYHLIFHQTQTLLFGNAFRLQGTLLLWMLMVFALVSAKIHIEDKIKPIFIVGILFVQLVCTIFFIGVGADRPVGTLGEPNALAATVLFLWPFLVFTWPKKISQRVLAGLGILFTLIILFISGSRSGIIALGVQISFIVLFTILTWRLRGSDKRKKSIKYATIISLIILFATYITPFIGPRTEYEDRGEIWKSAVHASLAHPIVGVGFGNAEYEYHRANLALGNKLQGYYVDNAHNIFLDWFVQAGIIGLGVLLFLLYNTFRTFIQTQQIRNIVLLIGLLAALSFNPASVVALIALWWLQGQGRL